MKNNGDIIPFVKQKDYIMVNNDLGGGSFGKTVLLKDPFIDELFVAKKYEPEYEEIKEQFYKNFLEEIKILHKLNHKNIVRVFNYYAYEDVFTGYILMEFIDGKTLDKFFHDWDFDLIDFDNVFQQLIEAFKYLEENSILHRDIREGNILVDNLGLVKVIDFGLGKIFKPTSISEDSMVDIINRSGLDTLPKEYFDGTYDSQTDMFYLAELFNRLLKKSQNEEFFSYQTILSKMMSSNKNDRFENFATVQDAINKKDFANFEISSADKKIYQSFSNIIENHLNHYTSEKKFNNDIDDFYKKLKVVIQKNCFENEVQNNADLISTVVISGYSYSTKREIAMEVITNFEAWFSKLSSASKQLVLNNIISKISYSIKEVIEDDELPF